MRKISLLSIILIFATTQAFSQYFTIKLGGGYAWPGLQNSGSVLTFQPGVSTDPAYANIIPLVNYNTTITDSLKNRYKSNLYAGYGTGGHFDFSFGYMINPYFGVQIDGAYLWGKSIKATQIYDAGGVLGNNTKITTTTHSNGLSLNPSLYFRAAKPSSKIAPYARAGIALPVLGAIYHTLDISSPTSILGPGGAGPINAKIGVRTDAALSVGFQGAIGVSYTPVPLMSVWLEVSGQYLLVKAKESTLTQYDLASGSDPANSLLSGLTTYSKVTHFVDKLDQNSNAEDFKIRDGSGAHNGQSGYVDESKGHDVLRQVANLASIGISVGVTFNMSKKIFTDPFGKKAKAEADKK